MQGSLGGLVLFGTLLFLGPRVPIRRDVDGGRGLWRRECECLLHAHAHAVVFLAPNHECLYGLFIFFLQGVPEHLRTATIRSAVLFLFLFVSR